MGEYLPLIIGIIVLIYRVYVNFVKEQEKARKRNPAERYDLPQQEEKPVIPPPVRPGYIPQTELIEETYNPERPYEPVYKHIRPEAPAREKYEAVKQERIRPETAVVTRYKEDVPKEVSLSRSVHAPHKHGITEENHHVQERSAYADFDVNDAVIKSAILNRPEY